MKLSQAFLLCRQQFNLQSPGIKHNQAFNDEDDKDGKEIDEKIFSSDQRSDFFMCAHTHAHKHTHTLTHIHTQTRIYTRMYTKTHTYTHPHTLAHTHTRTYADTDTHKTQTHAYVHVLRLNLHTSKSWETKSFLLSRKGNSKQVYRSSCLQIEFSIGALSCQSLFLAFLVFAIN